MIGTIGGVTLPIAAASVDGTLASLDPVRAALGGLLKTALNGELGAAWAKVTAGLPSTHVLAGSTPVRTLLELEPGAEVLEARRVLWPLLAVYRQGKAEYARHSIRHLRRVQRWNADFILGPVAVDDARRFGDALTAATGIVAHVLHHGFYPGFGTGRPFALPCDRVQLIGHVGPGWAKMEAQGQEIPKQHFGLTCEIETWELLGFERDPATDTPLAAGETLGAVDLRIGLEGADSTIDDFVAVGPPEP